MVREYNIRFDNCPSKAPMKLNFDVPQSNLNSRISTSGTISVSEEVSGKLTLVLETNFCTLDMKKCEKTLTFNFKEICAKLKDTKAFYSSFLSNFHPRLECPFKAGNYTKNKSELDLSFLAPMALDGKVFVTEIRLLSFDADKRNRKVVMCINAETKITKVRAGA